MNCVIYARFSPRPDAELSESIELQLEKCTSYAGLKQYHIVQTLSEREISGARADNRPELQKALRLACSEKAVLICYSLSRLARNTRDALEIADRLHKAGAGLALLDLDIDTSSPMGRCVFTILSAVAELERRQIAQRTSDSMQRKQKHGKRMSRHAPWGFRLMGSEIFPDSRERMITSHIMRMHGQGMSINAIRRSLKATNMLPRGKDWYLSTISQIIASSRDSSPPPDHAETQPQ
jgi:site-specific DNA recombinase